MPWRDSVGVTGDRNGAAKRAEAGENKPPLERAIADVDFLKKKAEEGGNSIASIAYGMAITIMKSHK